MPLLLSLIGPSLTGLLYHFCVVNKTLLTKSKAYAKFVSITMQKQTLVKTHILSYIGAFLSVIMSLGIVAMGAHAKDVAAYMLDLPHGSSVAMETAKKVESVSHAGQGNAKVTAELHNHIEKQTLNSLVKSMSDDTRHVKRAYKVARKQAYEEPETASFASLWQRAFGLA